MRWSGDPLGDCDEVVEEGLSGRVTAPDDPTDPRLSGARCLVRPRVAPPARSEQLADPYGAMGHALGLGFLDPGPAITTEGVDGIGLPWQNDVDLGRAPAPKVRAMLSSRQPGRAVLPAA